MFDDVVVETSVDECNSDATSFEGTSEAICLLNLASCDGGMSV